MEWLTTNWLWLLIFVAFIAMHLFGHGSHGSHGGHGGHGGGERQQSPTERGTSAERARAENTSASEHRH